MSDSFDPYYTWLGIPPAEQPANHYRLLAIARFESNEDVIINAADQRMAYVRTFQTGKHIKESQRLLNEISAAQVCLLDPPKKQAYDDQLRQKQPAAAPRPAPQPATEPGPFSAPDATPRKSKAAKERRRLILSYVLLGAGAFGMGLLIVVGIVVGLATRRGNRPTVASAKLPRPVSEETAPAPVPQTKVLRASTAAASSGSDAPASSKGPSSPPVKPRPAPVPPPQPAPVKAPNPILVRLPTFSETPLDRLVVSPQENYVAIHTDKWNISAQTGKGGFSPRNPVREVVFSSDERLFAVVEPERTEFHGLTPGGHSVDPTPFVPGGTIGASVFSADRRWYVAAVSGPERLVAYDIEAKKTVDSIQTTLPDVAWIGACCDWIVCWSQTKKAEAISLRDPGQRHDLQQAMEFPPLWMGKQGETPTAECAEAHRPGPVEHRPLESRSGPLHDGGSARPRQRSG